MVNHTRLWSRWRQVEEQGEGHTDQTVVGPGELCQIEWLSCKAGQSMSLDNKGKDTECWIDYFQGALLY